MGTRSVTIIMSDEDQDDPEELCRIYRQFDGYPEGHGIELAELCDRVIVNGIPGGVDETTISNGMGDLAAQIIMGLKKDHGVGGIYLEVPNGDMSSWIEYIYIVRGIVGGKPTIECRTQVGEFPFNVQTKEGLVFKGTAAEWRDHDFDKDEDEK